jgi:chromosome segregation ATPase
MNRLRMSLLLSLFLRFHSVNMSKLSIILNSLTVLVSLTGFVLVQINVSNHERKLGEIKEAQKLASEADEKLKELKGESASKIMRQKSRNEDLREQISEWKQSSQGTIEKLATTKGRIEELENTIVQREEEVGACSEREKEAAGTLQEKLQLVQALRSEIPRIEQQLENKKFEIRDYEERAEDLAGRLLEFDEITKVLRQHYLDTVSSIRTYLRERPWIEKGESLNVNLGKVDLASGYIALSEGGAAGLREDMLFSVQHLKEEISKIRIKKVFRTYALAEVIPLVGNSYKLLALQEVDLVAL